MGWVRSKLGAKREGRSDAKERARGQIRGNAEKAIGITREAGVWANIAGYRAFYDGRPPANDPGVRAATRGAGAGFSQLPKRSKLARSGDAS